jgi:hypothetical protein
MPREPLVDVVAATVAAREKFRAEQGHRVQRLVQVPREVQYPAKGHGFVGVVGTGIIESAKKSRPVLLDARVG